MSFRAIDNGDTVTLDACIDGGVIHEDCCPSGWVPVGARLDAGGLFEIVCIP